MSCTLLQMLVKPNKMTAGPNQNDGRPRVMLTTTHLMVAKDQRGPPYPYT